VGWLMDVRSGDMGKNKCNGGKVQGTCGSEDRAMRWTECRPVLHEGRIGIATWPENDKAGAYGLIDRSSGLRDRCGHHAQGEVRGVPAPGAFTVGRT